MKSTFPPQSYDDINWEELHKNAQLQKAWKSKDSKDWDNKAPAFSKNIKKSEYIDLIISHLPLQNDTTLLDIGSGPGTLALPIAKRISHLTAIDFSHGMLDELNKKAHQEGINNITTCCCAWEDDWHKMKITPHDITLASRSMGVKDLKGALCKLNNFAKKYVFLTDRISPTPFDQEAFKLLGRPFHSGPDYIFTVNMLYTMGIYPCIKILEFDRHKRYDNLEAALQAYQWMFHDITVKESDLLRSYLIDRTVFQDDNEIIIEPKIPHRWALIWWQKKNNHPDLFPSLNK